MAKRLISQLIFWVLMIVLITGAAFVVVFLYLPFVALKALYLGLSGKLGRHGPGRRAESESMA